MERVNKILQKYVAHAYKMSSKSNCHFQLNMHIVLHCDSRMHGHHSKRSNKHASLNRSKYRSGYWFIIETINAKSLIRLLVNT